jgi:glutathione S-transferase
VNFRVTLGNAGRRETTSHSAESYRAAAALENWLGGRDYLEDRFTAADLMMTTVPHNLRQFDIVSDRRVLKAYQERCETRSALHKAIAHHLEPFKPISA